MTILGSALNRSFVRPSKVQGTSQRTEQREWREDRKKGCKDYSEHATTTGPMASQQLWLPALGLHKAGPTGSQSWTGGSMRLCSSLLNNWLPRSWIIFSCVAHGEHTRLQWIVSNPGHKMILVKISGSQNKTWMWKEDSDLQGGNDGRVDGGIRRREWGKPETSIKLSKNRLINEKTSLSYKDI